MGTARLWLETTAAAAAARDGDGDTAPLERLRGRGLGASQTVNVLNTLTHCRLSTGHPAGGLAAADEALALAERAGLAHSLGPAPAVNRVEALYRLGRWDEAGAAPLARRIARRAGRAGLTGPSGGPLTARESEVLQLLARGRSNREIGAELFISPKTASVHVSHILAKLGVSSRGEAAAAARDRGLA